MAEDDWTIVPKVSNKWQDEEDEDIKENWDDDDDDEPSKSSSNADSSQQQPKESKPATTVAATGGKKKKKEFLKKLAEKENEKPRPPKTAEELLAEKLEQQRLVEESDLSIAKETFGISGSGGDSSAVLSSIRLATKDDFETFRKALDEKLTPFVRSVHYVTFVDNLVRSLASGLDADDIKKLNSSLTALYNEKIKLQKQQTKGGKKGKRNETVVLERDNDYSYDYNNQYQDDFEDYF